MVAREQIPRTHVVLLFFNLNFRQAAGLPMGRFKPFLSVYHRDLVLRRACLWSERWPQYTAPGIRETCKVEVKGALPRNEVV